MALKTDSRTQELEDLLPISREERLRQLTEHHGLLNQLERRIKVEGISPDDYALYHDWLEWRAAQHELDRLLEALKTAL